MRLSSRRRHQGAEIISAGSRGAPRPAAPAPTRGLPRSPGKPVHAATSDHTGNSQKSCGVSFLSLKYIPIKKQQGHVHGKQRAAGARMAFGSGPSSRAAAGRVSRAPAGPHCSPALRPLCLLLSAQGCHPPTGALGPHGWARGPGRSGPTAASFVPTCRTRPGAVRKVPGRFPTGSEHVTCPPVSQTLFSAGRGVSPRKGGEGSVPEPPDRASCQDLCRALTCVTDPALCAVGLPHLWST